MRHLVVRVVSPDSVRPVSLGYLPSAGGYFGWVRGGLEWVGPGGRRGGTGAGQVEAEGEGEEGANLAEDAPDA